MLVIEDPVAALKLQGSRINCSMTSRAVHSLVRNRWWALFEKHAVKADAYQPLHDSGGPPPVGLVLLWFLLGPHHPVHFVVATIYLYTTNRLFS